MAWNTTNFFPTWGDSGEQPPTNFSYADGDFVNEKHLDYLWASLYGLENDVWDALTDIDADTDGRVDAADTAALLKNNDIDSDGDGVVDDADNITETYKGSDLDTEYSNANGQGIVSKDNAGIMHVTDVANGATFSVYHASLTAVADPAPNGTSLRIITLDGSGGGTNRATVVSGDGTMHVGVEGTPLASWQNNTGAEQTVALVLDNGEFGSGTGSYVELYGNVTARIE